MKEHMSQKSLHGHKWYYHFALSYFKCYICLGNILNAENHAK